MREVGGYSVPTVNSCLLASEIGDELCKQFPEAPFAAVYYVNKEGQQAWSLPRLHRSAAALARSATPRE